MPEFREIMGGKAKKAPEFREIMKPASAEEVKREFKEGELPVEEKPETKEEIIEKPTPSVAYEEVRPQKAKEELPPSGLLYEVYESAIALSKEVYDKLAEDKLPPYIIDTVRKLIDVLKREPKEFVKLALSYSDREARCEEYIPVHTVDVTILSLYIGLGLELSPVEIENLGVAGLLHCVGRPLGREKEIEVSASHLRTKAGYVEIVEKKLNPIEYVNEEIKSVLKTHHEMMGPNIYPFEKIENPNRLAKILCAADTYCTLLRHPIIKQGYYPYSALMWMIEHNGDTFDREVLKLLVDTIGIYPPGTWVELSTGEIGIVEEAEVGSPMRPCVKVMFNRDWKELRTQKVIYLFKDTVVRVKRVIKQSEVRKKG